MTLALNLSPETRSSVEQLGFWFAPNKYPSSMGINLRNTMFGFFLGRVMFNYITDPTGTMEEFKSITWTELRDRMLSNNYLATWLGRFVFQFFPVQCPKVYRKFHGYVRVSVRGQYTVFLKTL